MAFKEEIFSQIPPEDKFIIDKHFDDIGEAFLGNYGYNNNTINAKKAAQAYYALLMISLLCAFDD